jgi:hypothetical protein
MAVKIGPNLIKERKTDTLIIDFVQKEQGQFSSCYDFKIKWVKKPIDDNQDFEKIKKDELTIYINKHLNNFFLYNNVYIDIKKVFFYKKLIIKCDEELSGWFLFQKG